MLTDTSSLQRGKKPSILWRWQRFDIFTNRCRLVPVPCRSPMKLLRHYGKSQSRGRGRRGRSVNNNFALFPSTMALRILSCVLSQCQVAYSKVIMKMIKFLSLLETLNVYDQVESPWRWSFGQCDTAVHECCFTIPSSFTRDIL